MSRIQEIKKAFSDIGTKLSEEETKKFLTSFGGAKTILQLKEKYYDDFLHGSLMIMRYGAIAFLNTRQL